MQEGWNGSVAATEPRKARSRYKFKEKQHLEKKEAGRTVGGAAGGAAEGGRQRPGCHHFRFWCARLRRAGKRKVAVTDVHDDDDYEEKRALFVTFKRYQH